MNIDVVTREKLNPFTKLVLELGCIDDWFVVAKMIAK